MTHLIKTISNTAIFDRKIEEQLGEINEQEHYL